MRTSRPARGASVSSMSPDPRSRSVGSVGPWARPTTSRFRAVSHVPGRRLQVIDVSIRVPSRGSSSQRRGTDRMLRSRVYAYVADDRSGLRVIDVSTPSAPVEVGFVDTPDRAWSVAVEGRYAYVVWGVSYPSEGGLLVIDVSTPSAPVEVGSVGGLGDARDVAVAGGYAYVVWGAWYPDAGVCELSTFPLHPRRSRSAPSTCRFAPGLLRSRATMRTWQPRKRVCG